MPERLEKELLIARAHLQARGWPSVRVRTAQPDEAFDLIEGRPGRCGDSRYHGVSPDQFGGPTAFGSPVMFVAAMKYGFDERGIFHASVSEEKEGYRPSIHGDENNGLQGGCGWLKLLMENELRTLHPAGDFVKRIRSYGVHFAEWMATKILHLDGEIHILPDKHREEQFRLNFKRGTTLKPDPQYFDTDVHYLVDRKRIALEDVIDSSAETVEKLSEVREAVLII